MKRAVSLTLSLLMCGSVFSFASCEDETTTPTPAHEHSYTSVVVNPTCTEKGNQNRMCTVCKTVFETKAIDAKGHTESEWIVKTPASCDQVGESFKICTACGAECDRKKDVVNHLPGPIITETEASCTQEGKKCQYCLYCQKLLGSKAIPKTEHVYVTENGQTLCKNCKEPKD